ncbi:MAG TPA: DUF4404 family protein [Steroidobacteraceae bacterium]|nr:DUF4404 family protein [Steroidobacteraceae bacterium]
MDTDALREQLMKLHEELGVARRIDPRSQQLLGEIMEDIKRLMDQDLTAGGPAGIRLPARSSARSLPDRLEQIAVQFEADHPTLAASSRRLVDLLGKVGL